MADPNDFNAMELQRAQALALQKKRAPPPPEEDSIDFSRPYADETTAVYVPPVEKPRPLAPPSRGGDMRPKYQLRPRDWR